VKTHQLKKQIKTETDQAVYDCLLAVATEYPSLDGITLWLFAQYRKDGLKLGDDGELRRVAAKGSYRIPFGEWIAWWESKHPSRVGLNVFTKTIAEVHKLVKTYSKEQAKLTAVQGAVVHTFSDGWTVQCLGADQLAWEGGQMGHCVGDTNMGYEGRVKNRELAVFSLRDAAGKPHTTLDITLRRMVNEEGKSKRNRGLDKFSSKLDPKEWTPTLDGALFNHVQAKSGVLPTPQQSARLREWLAAEDAMVMAANAQPLKSLRELAKAQKNDWEIPANDYGCLTWTSTDWVTLLQKAFHAKDVDKAVALLYAWAEHRGELDMLGYRVIGLQRAYRARLAPEHAWEGGEYARRVDFLCEQWDVQSEPIEASERRAAQAARRTKPQQRSGLQWAWAWVAGSKQAKATKNPERLLAWEAMRERIAVADEDSSVGDAPVPVPVPDTPVGAQ
jgi:hypothetical protein